MDLEIPRTTNQGARLLNHTALAFKLPTSDLKNLYE